VDWVLPSVWYFDPTSGELFYAMQRQITTTSRVISRMMRNMRIPILFILQRQGKSLLHAICEHAAE
jgi:nitrate reductase beta subunit